MAFSKFMIIVLAIYGLYYLIVFVFDLLKASPAVADDSAPVHYDVASEPPPVKPVLDDMENERIGGSRHQKSFQSEEMLYPEATEEHKNLGVDLGLETISPEGMEVTKEKIQRISNY